MSTPPTGAAAAAKPVQGSVQRHSDPSASPNAAASTLASELSATLLAGEAECVICTDKLHRADGLWACRTCYGLLHLKCVDFWAKHKTEATSNARGESHANTPVPVGSFRCPLCQSASPLSALVNTCFCGKHSGKGGGLASHTDASLVPGTCGTTCGRRRPDPACVHTCPLPCHPGPCPACPLQRDQGCHCGADEKPVGCSSGEGPYSCGEECGKELACGRHYCELKCHAGPCKPCAESVPDCKCHCGQVARSLPCAADLAFSCDRACGKLLGCGAHKCHVTCHTGACAQCPLAPALNKCACGRDAEASAAPRASCTEPLPTCSRPCHKPLACGEHLCPLPCHAGACAPCLVMTKIPCRCGASATVHPCFTSYVPLPRQRKQRAPTADDADGAAASCSDSSDDGLPPRYDRSAWLAICEAHGLQPKTLPRHPPPLLCQRRCKAKMSCRRHGCDTVCCGDRDHLCTLVCRKRAPCGVHECGQLCHLGPCPPCANVSFDPLYCRCRRTVIDPPVPCSTPPPRCNHPCPLPRACGHPPMHNCHQGECPPCAMLVERKCDSHGVTMDWHVACHLPSVSCGRACGKKAVCGSCDGICTAVCHAGPCPDPHADGCPNKAWKGGKPGGKTGKKK